MHRSGPGTEPTAGRAAEPCPGRGAEKRPRYPCRPCRWRCRSRRPGRRRQRAGPAFGAYQRGYYATALAEAEKRIATNPDDGAAMTLIGELYAQGLGAPRDATEAARWYKLAADRGDRQATFALGLAMLTGTGTPKNRDGAAALFQKAAAEGHPGALYNLGVMAIENDKGVVPDFTGAAKYFREAADLGDSDAAYALGLLYRNGTGVRQKRRAGGAMDRPRGEGQ